MKAVVCRVNHAAVVVDGQTVGRCATGLLVYIGVVKGDTPKDADWLADKLVALRIFSDEHGKMNLSVADVGGGLLLISNFTLGGRAKKGTRPSFTDAAPPEVAQPLFDRVVERCVRAVPTETGRFGAPMTIDAQFEGPITLVVDSNE